MAAPDQCVDGWTAVLRRQPARIVDGRPKGPYADVFEIIWVAPIPQQRTPAALHAPATWR